MSLQIGVSLPQGWNMELAGIKDPIEAYEVMTRVAQTADEVGFASAWLVDHFHTTPRPSQEATLECWTTTAAPARDTRRIRMGQTVTCNGYRNPALLAKMASTVDVLSHGRLNFGIGAGWHKQEYRSYGYDYPQTALRLRRLGEAVQVILAMWTQEEAVFEGTYYQVRGAINQPRGVQHPHIPILIGGGGEQVTLKLVAQYADACNVFGDLETIKHKFAVLKAHTYVCHRLTHQVPLSGKVIWQGQRTNTELLLALQAYLGQASEKCMGRKNKKLWYKQQIGLLAGGLPYPEAHGLQPWEVVTKENLHE
jgi:F420-dependent oxidoreductase-like protein